MLPKVTKFATLYSLSSFNLLGTGSLAFFWVFGSNGLKPASAYTLNPHPATLEPTGTAVSPQEEPSLVSEDEISFFPQEQDLNSATGDVLPQDTPQQQPSTTQTGVQTLSLQTPASVVLSIPSTSRANEAKGDGRTKPESNLTQAASPLPSDSVGITPQAEPEFRSLPPIAEKSQEQEKPAINAIPPVVAQLTYPPQTPNVLPIPATPIPTSSRNSKFKERQIPALPQAPSLPQTSAPVSPYPYNPTVGQLPYYPQYQAPIPTTGFPTGQVPYYPQPVLLVPVPATGMPMSPGMGQMPYYPQPVLLVPVPAMGMPMSPPMGQAPYFPQNVAPLPAPLNPNPVGFNGYNPGIGQTPYYLQPVAPTAGVGTNYYNPNVGQPTYYPQNVAPTAPVGTNYYNPNVGQPTYYPQNVAPTTPVGTNYYNPNVGQPTYYPQNVAPLPPPLNPGSVGFNGYNPMGGQSPYPQPVPPLPAPMNQSSGVPNGYVGYGQPSYYPQGTPPLPTPQTQYPVGANGYNPTVGQSPYPSSSPSALPFTPNPNFSQPLPNPNPVIAAPSTPQTELNRNTAVTEPYLRLQGTYVNQGDVSSARARVTGLYPLNSRVQFGGSLDLVSGDDFFADSGQEGLNLNELYVATAPFESLPNFRLVAGQLDLTSYFDRNSFAKDGATHFFNPVFQTNPALSATGIASRPAVLVNWAVTDNIEAKAGVFSSARDAGDFSLDGFAGEIGLRYGNAIIRGTYASARDAGSRTGFREIFGLQRQDGSFGLRSSDREQAYGVNVEYFFSPINMGVFGRYGRYDNRTLGRGGDTYSIGISFLDVFAKDDRLGLAYGRGLSNEILRRERGDDVPDVLELFYDFKFLPNLRLGFTLQQQNSFRDTFAGFRVKTEFDITPPGEVTP